MYKYKAFLKRVVDGDTYDLIIDVGFSILIEHRFRLKDVDTPETWRPKSEAERIHGEAATAFVIKELTGKEFTVSSSKLGIYGRYECDIMYGDLQDLATELKNNGFEKRDSYDS